MEDIHSDTDSTVEISDSSIKKRKITLCEKCNFCKCDTHRTNNCNKVCTKLSCIKNEYHLKINCIDFSKSIILTTVSFVDNKDQDIDDLQIKKLKKRCDTYIAKNVELTETVEELVEKNEKLCINNKKINNDLMAKTKEVLIIKMKNKNLEEIELLKTKNEEFETKFDTIESKNEELKTSLLELEIKNAELKTKLEALELFLVEKNILLNKYQRANNTLSELKALLKSILD